MKNLKNEKGVVTTPTEDEQQAVVGGGVANVDSRTDDPTVGLAQVKRQRGRTWVNPGDPPQGH